MLCYYGDDMEEYRRWEDNIKMDLKEICVNVRSWTDLTHDRDYWRAYVCGNIPMGWFIIIIIIASFVKISRIGNWNFIKLAVSINHV